MPVSAEVWSTMFPQAQAARGLDLPDTPAEASQPLGASERPFDGLRDAIALGVPAVPPTRSAAPARVALNVAGHRPLRAEWRQHGNLGELLLDAIQNESHLNHNVSPGVLNRLRFVLAGVHLTAGAVTLNYSGQSDIYAYVAAVGGMEAAEETVASYAGAASSTTVH